LVAGVVGFVTIVLIFLAADWIANRPLLSTPALLGNALFFGVTRPSEIAVSRAPVLAYSAAHLAVFLIIGGIAAALASLASRRRHAWYLALNLVLLVVAHASGIALALSESMQGAVSTTLMAVATLISALAMAGYLLRVNPQLVREALDRQYRDE
jgi:hypothetical protein